jgi:hypothetical protein
MFAGFVKLDHTVLSREELAVNKWLHAQMVNFLVMVVHRLVAALIVRLDTNAWEAHKLYVTRDFIRLAGLVDAHLV